MRSGSCPSRPPEARLVASRRSPRWTRAGPRSAPEQPPRELPDQQRDLRGDPINTRHEIVYTRSPPNFFINGEHFTGPENVFPARLPRQTMTGLAGA
jgi:hypothetical protein